MCFFFLPNTTVCTKPSKSLWILVLSKKSETACVPGEGPGLSVCPHRGTAPELTDRKYVLSRGRFFLVSPVTRLSSVRKP